MYNLESICIEEDKIQLKIFYEALLIGSKIFELHFNENKKASFVESGYEYSSMEFNSFISNVESLVPDIFSFDDQDRFDGFMFIKSESKTNVEYYLILKIAVELTNVSIYVRIDENSVKGIVHDLRTFYNMINNTIESQLNYFEKLENPDKYNEEI
jgi:hypothetical protein